MARCTSAARRGLGRVAAGGGRRAVGSAPAVAAPQTTPMGNPLPETLHAALNSPPGGRVVLVGDVHGCCTELEELLLME